MGAARANVFGNGKIGYSGSWGGVLKKEDEIQNYESQIQLILKQIERTESGRILIGTINQTSRLMLIVPDAATEMNAATIASNTAQAYPAGIRFVDDKTHRQSITVGGGSCAFIELTPGNYSRREGIFSGADTGLFHEMCHGLHNMLGVTEGHLSLEGGFDNVEEFWAITLTNIYLSEKNYPQLRKDHHGRFALDHSLCTSEAFYQWAKAIVKMICESAPTFTKQMAGVKAKFNPLKAYYDDVNRAAHPRRA